MSRNLLKNPCAKEGLDNWEVVRSGGDGFSSEKEPVGCKKLSEFSTVSDDIPCWATSYTLCEKYQLVNLQEFVNNSYLDNKQPPIRVHDWYCARTDCGCEYNISVRLLADDKLTELDAWNFTDVKEAGSDWTKAQHVFQNYPAGVRYVEFKHGGKDTKYWAGHYGAKMTNSGVFVEKRSMKEKLGMNLLQNPCGSLGFECWEIVSNGGNGWCCEANAVGCRPITAINEEAEGEACWATSYQDCEKKQVIDLVLQGFYSNYIDIMKPAIKVSEWYCARTDCGCKYKISVRLLADDKVTQLDAWNFTDIREEGSEWTKVEHVFEDYPSGVRYIEFKHGGQDTKFWAGHYGAKITSSCVCIGKKKEKRAMREKLGKNLLKNPCASSGLDNWEIVSNGGNGWRCEAEPAGCKPIKEVNEDAEGETCWSTSYQDCKKRQFINLEHEGFDPDYIDKIQPEIKVCEWFGSRSDAGCSYWLVVRLLTSDMKMIDERTVKEIKDGEGDWYKVEERFTAYGRGVRVIEYSHGGCDTCGWAGNYGAKITCSFVAVNDGAETWSTSSSSSSDEF